MKTFIRTFVLPWLFIVAISTQVSAQTRRNTSTTNKKEQTARITTVKKNTTSKRVTKPITSMLTFYMKKYK